jgi:hypothetical protein
MIWINPDQNYCKPKMTRHKKDINKQTVKKFKLVLG